MRIQLLKDYISREQLAAELGKSVKTLVRWENDEKGPPVTRNGRDAIYYIPSTVKWLKAQERAAKGSTKNNAA